MYRTEEEWVREYWKKSAFWMHDGNPKHPHALLTSGNHSNGFFDSRLIIADEPLLRQAASDLLGKLVQVGFVLNSADCVVGPQTGATKLARFMSDTIGWRRDKACRWASPAKDSSTGVKRMIFDDPDHTVLSGDSVLLCEDVLSTGGSVELAEAAMQEKGAVPLPYITVLVNRSGLKDANRKRIIALIDRPMPIWKPEICPLCLRGSEAIRPKEGDNWEKLAI